MGCPVRAAHIRWHNTTLNRKTTSTFAPLARVVPSERDRAGSYGKPPSSSFGANSLPINTQRTKQSRHHAQCASSVLPRKLNFNQSVIEGKLGKNNGLVGESEVIDMRSELNNIT